MNNQSNQTVGTQTQQSTRFCPNCGAALAPGQAFCSTCGAPAPAPAPVPQKRFCNQCGFELEADAVFCPSCGNRMVAPAAPAAPAAPVAQAAPAVPTEPAPAPVADTAPAVPQKKSKKKTALIVVGVIAAAAVVVIALVVALIVGALILFSDTPESLMAEGDYLAAYELEEDSALQYDILAESVIADRSSFVVDGLKDPTSFILREAYYYPFVHDDGAMGSYAILYVSGTNSYGARVSSYWAFTLGKDETWNYIGNVDVTYDESGDDIEEMLIKLVVNAGIEKGTKLDSEQVSRINQLFEDGLLDYTTTIPWNMVDKDAFDHD